MKKLGFLFILLLSYSFGQSQTAIKGNVSALLGFPQIGAEFVLSEKTSFQIDAFASLWKSINGGPQQVYMIFPEFRYYPKKSMAGLYFGLHIGGSKYKFQKWNYINTDNYQEGYSVMYGGTIGYQVKINDRFSLDAFLGGGSQQGYYNGYLLSTGEAYEHARNYNKSGEWLPYRGGIMIVYKLGSKNEK